MRQCLIQTVNLFLITGLSKCPWIDRAKEREIERARQYLSRIYGIFGLFFGFSYEKDESLVTKLIL